jgi:hypothetical protein
MGMVPVYVYNNLVWLADYDSIRWSDMAFVVHIKNLTAFFGRVMAMKRNKLSSCE